MVTRNPITFYDYRRVGAVQDPSRAIPITSWFRVHPITGARIAVDPIAALTGGTVVVPPAPTVLVGDYPFDVNAVWNYPIGDGITPVPTSDSRHVELLPTSRRAGVNITDWVDTYYKARPGDPSPEIIWCDSLPGGWDASDVTPESLHPATGYSTRNAQGTYVTNLAKQTIPAGTYQIPIDTKWMSDNNTDRKAGVLQADGYTVVWMHKFTRTVQGGAGRILTTNFEVTDLREHGMRSGAIMSKVSVNAGNIFGHEIKKAQTGAWQLAIMHSIKFGISNGLLKAGFIWPSASQDSDASTKYLGECPPGTFIYIPGDRDITALRHLTTGLPLTFEGLAVLAAFQNYGGYCLIRSGSAFVTENGVRFEKKGVGTIQLQIENTDKTLPNSVGTNIRDAVNAALAAGYFRIADVVVPFDPTTRIAIDPTAQAGGGVHPPALMVPARVAS